MGQENNPPRDAVRAVMLDRNGQVVGARTNGGVWLEEADAKAAYRDTVKAGLRVVPMIASPANLEDIRE